MTSPTVLIVEDEAIVAMELEEKLNSMGYVVLTSVSSGEQAIARSEQLEPDLVLMDIRLDGALDGIEAAEIIGKKQQIPVVYLTAHTDDKTLQRAKLTEPFGYLVKPFSERELKTTLEMALYKSKMERQLKESEERFRAVIESAEDLIFVKDASLRYTHVNPAMLNLLGGTRSQVIGKTDADLLIPYDARQSIELDHRVLEGQSVEFEYTSDVGGNPTTYSFIRVPLKDSLGRVTGLAGIGRDITELRRRGTSLEAGDVIDQPEKYTSDAIKRTLRQLRRAAKTDSICLFLGESGSGKDYLARYLHDCSPRARGPFFSINCAALIPELAESELFGHELGAFTGAAKRKRGLLELAESGTLLLNEIAELPLHLQAKFLAFLDTDSFTRVGGEANIKVNARVVAATNRDLEAEVEAGAFRKDLYYRLNVLAIKVPSVRERIEDLPLLARALMESFARKIGLHEVPTVDEAALELLMSYDWPGNVRELRNVLERALILGDKRRITARDIDLAPRDRMRGQKTGLSITVDLGEGVTMNEALREAKRQLVEASLGRSGGRVTEAARLLGLSRDAMNYLLRSLGTKGK